MTQKTLSETYLFNNVEVKLTGRYTTKTRIRSRQEVQVVVYEVEPVDEFNGTWKKWANEEELLEIQTLEK
jgi:hypothetical protein